jgi:hypothetical protein
MTSGFASRDKPNGNPFNRAAAPPSKNAKMTNASKQPTPTLLSDKKESKKPSRNIFPLNQITLPHSRSL